MARRDLAGSGPERWNHRQKIAELLRFPPQVFVEMCWYETCLFHEAIEFSPSVAHAMLNAGADPRRAPSGGSTALCRAVEEFAKRPDWNRGRLVRRILDAGVCIDTGMPGFVAWRDSRVVEQTPLACATIIAAESGCFAALDLLFRADARLEFVTCGGSMVDISWLPVSGPKAYRHAPAVGAAFGIELERRARWTPLRAAWIAAVVTGRGRQG